MTKQLLNLNTIQKITLILTTLLLPPMSSWATIYTTTGSPQTVTSDNETFYTWGVSSSEVGWEIRQNAASTGTITTSNDGASIICSNGCRIENFSLPANSSEYVWKIVIEGLTNNDNVTATCSNESQYAFTPTSTPGVFVLTQPFSLSGGAQFRILIADKECTITNISVYTTTTNYNVSVAGIPVVGENANDILGDGETGSVSFDGVNTLTLNNATIIPKQEAPGIDYMGSSDLTIRLNGNNVIQGHGGCEAIRYNGNIQTTPNLYFVKDGTQHCSLELIAGEGKHEISGFQTKYDDNTFFVYAGDENGANTHSTIYSTTILGGTGSAGEPHIIASANDLKKFIEYYNDGRLLSNANVRLDEHINCSGVTGFSQLADNTDATFRGLFDGNNKTISNLTLMGSGLFGYIEGGTVKDLTLSNYNLTGNDYPTGGIVAELSNNAAISNCTITNSTIACAGNQYNPEVGGIAARMSESTITGCIIDNVQVKAETTYTGGSGAYSNAGGIVARASSGTISSCIVTNGSKITNYYADESATLKAGAIVGSLNETTLTQNKYDYDVTVEHLNGTNTNNKTIKSDYTQRGTGEERVISDVSYYDVFEDNGAVLANTKTVTLPSNLGDKGEVEIEEGNYYNKDGDNYQIAVGKNVVVRVGAYEPFSIAAFTVSNTSETSFDEIGDGFREYTFVMPDADVTVAVNFAINISSEDYVATIASVTYNGASQVPASVTLTAQDGEEMVLTNSADSNDFTIKSYKINNETATSPIDAGTYTVTIEGIGNYTGTKDAEYVINKAKFSDVDIESIADQTYTGNEIMPAVKVTFNSHPVSAEEYDSVYTANINAGEATITLTSTGKNFVADAQKTKNFTISSKALTEATITLLETSFTYDGNAKNPTITIGFVTGASDAGGSSMITLTESTDYEVTYKKVTGETEESIEPNQVIDSGTYKVIATGKGNYSGTKEAEFTISNGTMDVSVIGYTGTYDSKAHGITVSAPEGAAIKYGTTEGTYTLDASPEYTDAGSYTVYYQVTRANYQTVTGSVTVEISKAEVSITYNEEGYTATYGETFTAPTPTTNPEGLTVTATNSSNTQVATVADGVVTIAGVGETNITVSFAGNSNYNATTTTYKLTVGAASMEIIGTGYSGTYDGKAHGITVSAPEDATVMYGTQEGKYDLTESPTYTDADTYIVYYQVTMDNYNTFTGSATVDISKADITPTVTLEGWTYGTTAKTPSITGNPGEGTVTYSYKAEGAETFGKTAPEIVGTHTIKASIAETTNYNAGEATATFTITAATMTVTAKGYEGTYDGKAHGITVSAPEDATIKYGTAEGSYELNASPEYTAGGNYTVYYQVTMDNYATVTGSETVKISKAEAELEFDVPEESKVYATIGKEFTEPTLNNLKGLDVTFSSSDESVATVDKNTGKVTLKSAGLTYITATFAGNDNYNEFAVKYELRVKGSYNLWIDNVQVTSDNYNDILENQKFFYDLVNKWLIITNNETPVTVKSSMPELTIYLNGKSELERIYFDNQGNAQNTGTLSFFNYNDVPGKLTLDTNNDNGVISGFSSISFDDNTKLRFIDPDSCEYKDGLVKMTKPSQLGEIVKQVTIGQYIEPMANGDGISFGNIDSETNITNMTIEDKLLITATQHEEGSNEDDDYIDPNNGAFVMNTTNTSEDVEVLSQGVESGNKQPGSEDYADSFRGGITFMIPSGTGTIELELMNEEGYMLMLKIGTGVPHEIVRYERATVVIDYNVDEPTYVYLYLEEKSIIGARRAGNNTRVGKRDKAHGTVFSVKVKAASVSSTNPLNNVEGATGNITIPDVNTTTPSGDDVPTKAEFKITNDENKANDDKWYTIDGQRINKPTQKGVYIRNRKKVVVK